MTGNMKLCGEGGEGERHGMAVVDLCHRRSVAVLCRGSKARQRRARPPGGARVSGGRGSEGRGGRPGNYLPAAIDGGKGGKWLRRPRGAAWQSCRSWGGPSCRRRAAPLPRACPDSGELSGRSCARFRGEVGLGERGDDGEHEAVRRGKRGRETRHGRGRPLLPAEGGRALPRQQGAAAAWLLSGRCTGEWGARE